MAFSYLEKKIFKQGYQRVAGIDEAGRGPLAGPVTAAVVCCHSEGKVRRMTGIRDSKQLSPKQRNEIFERIKQEPGLEWRVSFVWPQVIDRINIWRATQLAWRRCLRKLNPRPDFLFLDGNKGLAKINLPQLPVIKGDQKLLVLSLASIIAKVSRDRLMERLDRKYPSYQFKQHKGYSTRLHLERLRKYGPSEIHRKSFQPVFANLPFKDKVYYTVSKIPRGKVMTYKQVARVIGHPRAYRAVGNVLNKNANPQAPCHRVIRSNGQSNRGRAFRIHPLLRKGMCPQCTTSFSK
ncbi:MAG: ribonuclease HII [Patescibacteria group bacterium]